MNPYTDGTITCRISYYTRYWVLEINCLSKEPNALFHVRYAPENKPNLFDQVMLCAQANEDGS